MRLQRLAEYPPPVLGSARGGLLVLTLLVLVVAACSSEPAPDASSDVPDGEQLMRQMSDTLAGATTYRFSTRESLEPLETSSSREVMHFSRTVTVRRPDALFFELQGDDEAPVHVAVTYDGSALSLHDLTHGVWAQTEVPGTLDEMLDDVALRFSLPVPIADVVYSDPYGALVGPNSEGGYVGNETLDGVECAQLEYHDELVAVHIWIPVEGSALPRRLELVYKQAPGSPRARVDFTEWDLEAEIDPATFVVEMEDGATHLEFEELVARLLAESEEPSDGTESDGPASG